MTLRPPGFLFASAGLLLAGGLAAYVLLPVRRAARETLTIKVSEGTGLALDVSRDGRTVVFDLLGQLWLVPEAGGTARALTDAVADTAEDEDPSFAPDGRRIVFSAERMGRRGLWLFDPATPSPVQLYQLPTPESYAAGASWSPDGSRIAFARDRTPDSAGGRRTIVIALLDLGTRGVQDLRIEGVGEAFLRLPAWSADGRRIAFVSAGRGGSRFWSVDASGGTATLLAPANPRTSAFALSPDGRRITYLAPDSTGAVQVWVRDVGALRGTGGGAGSDTAATLLTRHDDAAATRVRWSADGRWLYYSADGKLQKLAAGGGSPATIPFTATLALNRNRPTLPPARFPEPGSAQPARGFLGLALSPDARRIGVIALGKLWIAELGGEARAIADVPHTARYVAWSPDGAEIAWAAGAGLEKNLFATDVASGATRKVTALPGDEVYPAYSPDGRWIAFTHTLSDTVTRIRLVSARGATAADTTVTRNLGPADAEWTGSDVSAPVWSPNSDALLRMIRGTGGELVPLDGARTPVTLPDTPNHLRWTTSGIVWARHDRLWSAGFGAKGIEGEPRALGNAPAMYPSVAVDGTVLFVSGGGLRLRTPQGQERSLGWPVRYTAPVPEPLVIRSARIIDGTGAPSTPPRDLLIERGRITRVASAGSIPAAGRRVLDAGGRFAIPGVMDLHAHIYWPELLPASLYFGVTLVRDQGSSMAPLVASADAIAAGALPGPRVSYGGFQYYSDWAFDEEQGRGVEPEADPEHAARAVALAEAFGAHHIKTRTFRRWDINARMIAEAHRRGMRATGHCVEQLPLVAAGIDAKEHLGYCGERYGSQVLHDDVAQLLRSAGIGIVPTITYVDLPALVTGRPERLEGDSDLAAFLPPGSSFAWILALPPVARASWARDARLGQRTVAALARAGVTIGTGTDVWQVPAGVHLELEHLVASGLTPLEAIRAATANSARIAGVNRDLGTLEVGKLADLILLDADPLADIRNTRRIWQVIKGGGVVDRAMIRENYRIRN